jgi:hypothetical protein
MNLRILFLGVLLFVASSAEAATLYIDPPKPTLNRGDAVTLAVRLDTDEAAGECVNAIDGVITYNNAITPVDISLGQSILPVWVEEPTIDKEKRTITFAGGIPNGYCGRIEGDPRLTNTVVELIFRAPGLTVGGGDTDPIGRVEFAPESKAYLNDGFGTEATLTTLGAELTLNKTVGTEIVDEWRDEINNDEIPPEEFTISLERDETAFDQKYYIVFNTTDKQSGISHYEVIEEAPKEAKLFTFGAATAPWIEARSPYVLDDQSLRSTIRVRAIDKAGNEYIATLQPQHVAGSFNWLYILAFAGVALLFFLTLAVWFISRRRRKKANEIRSEGVDEPASTKST